MKAELKLIVGLGNPGSAYKGTRHNAGAMAVERLAKQSGLSFKASGSLKSLSAVGEFMGRSVVLLLPQTFMNLSGEAVASAIRKRRVELANILIVHDDVSLELGQIRVKASGSSGGHNGLASVIELFGTKDIPRLRLGIGCSGHISDMSSYVLSKFGKDELGILGQMLDGAVEAIKVWACDGINIAMNRFNKKKTIEEPNL